MTWRVPSRVFSEDQEDVVKLTPERGIALENEEKQRVKYNSHSLQLIN